MHKGLEIMYSDYFTSITKEKEILLDKITCISPYSHNNLNDQSTILMNKLVILTIIYLQ